MNWRVGLGSLGLLALTVWLFVGPLQARRLRPTPGSQYVEFRIDTARGIIERTILEKDTPHEYRVRFDDGHYSPPMNEEQFRSLFGNTLHARLSQGDGNWFFQFFNISSYKSLTWVTLGLMGQAAFFMRMLVQWLRSEKEHKSVVPQSFWWLSLVGSLMLGAYFIWRQDVVGVLGQTTGIVIYARNLRLIWHEKRGAGRRSA